MEESIKDMGIVSQRFFQQLSFEGLVRAATSGTEHQNGLESDPSKKKVIFLSQHYSDV